MIQIYKIKRLNQLDVREYLPNIMPNFQLNSANFGQFGTRCQKKNCNSPIHHPVPVTISGPVSASVSISAAASSAVAVSAAVAASAADAAAVGNHEMRSLTSATHLATNAIAPRVFISSMKARCSVVTRPVLDFTSIATKRPFQIPKISETPFISHLERPRRKTIRTGSYTPTDLFHQNLERGIKRKYSMISRFTCCSGVTPSPRIHRRRPHRRHVHMKRKHHHQNFHLRRRRSSSCI